MLQSLEGQSQLDGEQALHLCKIRPQGKSTQTPENTYSVSSKHNPGEQKGGLNRSAKEKEVLREN